MKDTRCPIFGDTFHFKNITVPDLSEKTLVVSALDKKVIYPKNQALIGKVTIDLSTVKTVISNVEETDWYLLKK